ncbi:hypothetical protein [Flavobacterium sp. XS2P39]|uniref:hypothetical protein n=1 Tax=Flavobacterium sp. XS2P39 TaxID=3401725 RepID=UPI003AABC67B
MKRRAFLETVAGAALAMHTVPAFGQLALEEKEVGLFELMQNAPTVEAIPDLKKEFANLLLWLQENKWNEFFKESFGLNLDPNSAELAENLNKELLDVGKVIGFDDFAGCRAIEPGFPSMSLLYHGLASPRVTPKLNGVGFTIEQYPDLQKLEILENYITCLKDIQIQADDFNENYVFALFSYEYRPAFKTPESCPHAEFVYSRCGIARIGEHDLNYNKQKRSFVNEPIDPKNAKEIAIMPARYGLFLAKKVNFDKVKAISEENSDSRNYLVFKTQRKFLQPVKKIFDGDPFIGGGTIKFMESHKNEKLKKLVDRSDIDMPCGVFDIATAPFVRVSSSDESGNLDLVSHNSKLVSLKRIGSSILLNSVPAKIIRIAEQNHKTACFKVPKVHDTIVESNRRYTSLKLQNEIYRNAFDYAITEGVGKRYKATRFGAPRNAPLFVNIRYKVNDTSFQIEEYYGHDECSHEKIYEGGYYAAMFEDSICDGCLTASVIIKYEIDPVRRRKLQHIFPAFSLVSAPDFFPFADSHDLIGYDENGSSSFMEGGYENLSVSRLLANPNIIAPYTDRKAFPDDKKTRNFQHPEIEGIAPTFIEEITLEDVIKYDVSDTLLAIIAGVSEPFNGSYKEKEIYKYPKMRDYDATSFLSDTASFIFAPGWDATYSRDNKNRTYLATFGLGSPFPEDMKLCAAANGMWPVASPDAARTFQGGLKPLPVYNTVPPCAIPLMDDEIGYHSSHPDVKSNVSLAPTYGWDGEQGPFFEKYDQTYWINFTDIGSSDYIENLRDDKVGFNMEKLRSLKCNELIFRIDCLRQCKKHVEGIRKEFSTLWLVSAEKVNWSQKVEGYGVPTNLVGSDKKWATSPKNGIEGNGYLYIFADPLYDKYDDMCENYTWVGDRKDKRRRIKSKKIVVCQITKNSIAWCELDPKGYSSENLLKWNYA